MMTYAGLRRNEKQFRHWSGISVSEFDELYQDFEGAWVKSETERLNGRVRRRAIGGGGDYRLDVDTRLLLMLVWMRHYLTTEALGYLFGLHQSSVSRTISRTLPVLQSLAQAEWQNPPRKGGGRSLTQLKTEKPDLFAIMDATEQVVNRPQKDEQARNHFSGKQRRYTCKTLIHVNSDGLIRQVSSSQPGSLHDLTHLRQSGLLQAVPKDTIIVADSAFLGLHKDLPDQPLLLPYKAQRNHPLVQEQRYANRFISSIRIKVENVFAHLKLFRILAHRFRHDIATTHCSVFAFLARVLNLRTYHRLAALALAASY